MIPGRSAENHQTSQRSFWSIPEAWNERIFQLSKTLSSACPRRPSELTTITSASCEESLERTLELTEASSSVQQNSIQPQTGKSLCGILPTKVTSSTRISKNGGKIPENPTAVYQSCPAFEIVAETPQTLSRVLRRGLSAFRGKATLGGTSKHPERNSTAFKKNLEDSQGLLKNPRESSDPVF